MQTFNIKIDANRKETTPHGSSAFPLVIYHTRIKRNILGFIDWHWHDDLQFCLVTQGQVQFQVNQATLLVKTGEGLFINSGQLHKASNYQNLDSGYLCLDFQPQLLGGFAGSRLQAKYVQPYVGSSALQHCHLLPAKAWQQQLLQSLQAAYNLYTLREDGFELALLSELLQMWHQLYQHYLTALPSQAAVPQEERIKKIMYYLQTNYMHKLTLPRLAEEVNLSTSACCREFKKAMNCTIFTYLTNYRLVTAAQLLLNTRTSVTDIAYQCGFSGTSYFIEKFKLKTGISPFVYRKTKTQR